MPYMTVTYYTELLATKDIVLVRGDIINAVALSHFDVRARWVGDGVSVGHGVFHASLVCAACA